MRAHFGGRGFIALRQLEGLLKEVHEEIDAHSQLLIESCQAKEKGWGQYGAADNMLRLPNGTTIRIDKEPGVTVVDPEKFRLWCVANGLEQALRLWPSTTESLTKERLVAGAPPPDGIDVSYFFEKIVYKKG